MHSGTYIADKIAARGYYRHKAGDYTVLAYAHQRYPLGRYDRPPLHLYEVCVYRHFGSDEQQLVHWQRDYSSAAALKKHVEQLLSTDYRTPQGDAIRIYATAPCKL